MDYYEILGIGRDATPEDIATAYRKLALLYHPDRNLTEPEAAATKFKEIANAFEVLSHPDKRLLYDRGKLKDKPSPPPKPRKRNKYSKPKPQTGKPFYDRETQCWYDSPEQKAAAMETCVLRPLSEYTPPPPKFDIWGRPLTKDEQEEWIREQSGIHVPPRQVRRGVRISPKRDGYFFDSYSNQYLGGGVPDLR